MGRRVQWALRLSAAAPHCTGEEMNWDFPLVHANLTSLQAAPAAPCRAMAIPAVPWHDCLAAGQGCDPVPRFSTEESVQRGQPPHPAPGPELV